MAKNFLDKVGLEYFAGKIKADVNGKADKDLSNVENTAFAAKAASAGASGTPVVAATSTDGVTYTATVPNVTALTTGLTLTIIPNIVSTSTSVKLNVNNLGAGYIRLLVGYSTTTTTAAAVANWMGAGKPVQVQYDGAYWIADLQRASASAIYGAVKIDNGGTGATTAEEARVNLGAAKTVSYTATLSSGSWSSSAPYSMTVTVTGILATDEPIIDCVLSSDADASKLILEAWGCVSRITTAANSITAYCYDKKPTVNIPIKIKVVR